MTFRGSWLFEILAEVVQVCNAAELAAATTVVIASGNAMPISTTHTLVGAVFGVGLAMSAKDLDFKVIGKIIASWLTTVPAGAILSMLYLIIFRLFLEF